MRTSKMKQPDDPKCRVWNAREMARRVTQPGFVSQVIDSRLRAVAAAAFRKEKAARAEVQFKADLKEALKQAADIAMKKAEAELEKNP